MAATRPLLRLAPSSAARGRSAGYLGLCLGLVLVGVAVVAFRPHSTTRVQLLAIVGAQQLQFPAPPNYWQEPTVWQGRGGDKQQAELDDALHAYQMQRMRTRILDEETDQQRSQWDLMNEAAYLDDSDAKQRVRLSLTPSAKKADATQQMLMYGNVQLPEDSFSWKKESGEPQCEGGCAFQDKVFTVDGFDQLCLTHCGEIDGMLKDASAGQRAGVALAQRKVVRQQLAQKPNVRAEMLSEAERGRQRKAQAHEPWNVDSASRGAGLLEKTKYYTIRKERFDRGETAQARFPADDPYPLDSSWGLHAAVY